MAARGTAAPRSRSFPTDRSPRHTVVAARGTAAPRSRSFPTDRSPRHTVVAINLDSTLLFESCSDFTFFQSTDLLEKLFS